jgi:lysophospholipase L1-like esterase
LIGWAAIAGIAYVLGAVTVHKRWFPYPQFRDWKDRTVARPAEKPRASLFRFFSPDAEVVMVGDSITQGGIWAEMFPGVTIANRGVGGDTTVDVLARMDTILSTKPEVAFVMIGVNDAARGRSPEEIFASYAKVVDALQGARVEVVIQSTIECSAESCGSKREVLRELNRKLVALAAARGMDYIDLNGALSDEAGLKSAYTYDGTHLTGAGYRQWADALSETMERKVAGLRAKATAISPTADRRQSL